MTRIKISAVILCALIIASIVSGVWIDSRCERMLGIIGEISRYVDENDTEKASAAAEKLSENWESFRKAASVLVKNDKLSEIDRINARIIFLLQNGSDELESEITELQSMIFLLKTGETPVLTSVL